MTRSFEESKEILRSQPFSRLVGTELTLFLPGKVELTLALRDDLKQQHGFAHGGILSYLADNALAFAGGSMLGGNVVTGEFKINFLRPAVGTTLIAKANTKHTGKQQAVCQCDIYIINNNQEKLCATAQGTIVKLLDT